MFLIKEVPVYDKGCSENEHEGRPTCTRTCFRSRCCSEITNRAYQNHLSRLKYLDVNQVTGRRGVYNMGRNFSIKIVVPIEL